MEANSSTRIDGVIILVDDNVAHRLLCKRALHRAGIRTAINEFGSLKAAKEFLPQLLHSPSVSPRLFIVDLNLGDGRGSELVKEIRNHAALVSVPILTVSTSARQDDIRESYRAGTNCFVSKGDAPVGSFDELVSAVSFLLASTGS